MEADTPTPSENAGAEPDAGQVQPEKKKRRWGWEAIGVAAVIGLAALAGGLWATSDTLSNEEKAATPIEGVRTWQHLGREHTTESVDYPMRPPVGGDHNPIWLKCQGTVYTEEVRDENAVHSLEHGAVWITYTSEASEKDTATLKKLTTATDYTLMSPYEKQTAPIVLTAWGHQIEAESAEDARITRFLDAFVQGPQTPEPHASCEGGHMREAPAK